MFTAKDFDLSDWIWLSEIVTEILIWCFSECLILWRSTMLQMYVVVDVVLAHAL